MEENQAKSRRPVIALSMDQLTEAERWEGVWVREQLLCEYDCLKENLNKMHQFPDPDVDTDWSRIQMGKRIRIWIGNPDQDPVSPKLSPQKSIKWRKFMFEEVSVCLEFFIFSSVVSMKIPELFQAFSVPVWVPICLKN